MHISEGVLSAPVLITGAVFAAAGIAIGLRRLKEDRLMTAGLVGAAFFVASLVHVPVGFSSAHLILNGLVGVLLGWSAFPVIFIGLLLQAVLLQFGGLTVLGVNTFTMSTGAVAAGCLFHALYKAGGSPGRLTAAAFLAGACGILVSSLLTALALVFTEEGFWAAAAALLVAHLPIMVAEGIITVLVCRYLQKSAPELLSLNTRRTIA
ncbi:MAG: cobalt transporter CbiM [Sutterellaceae bacterium]|nr:cobalt transporter CbiM [Sutterellaceae bacterium]MDD7442619.1 cobalt transporter CbiM [Sutterellaceae bacterium]MDY2868452.1 cobalt transporter CbiM [Mesosutterella sp.]